MIRLEYRLERPEIGTMTVTVECEDWHPAADIEPWIKAWIDTATEDVTARLQEVSS